MATLASAVGPIGGRPVGEEHQQRTPRVTVAKYPRPPESLGFAWKLTSCGSEPNDVRPDRGHAGTEPPLHPSVKPPGQGAALWAAQAKEGSMRGPSTDAAWPENMQNAWAALRMVREAVETLGILISEEEVL